MLCTLNLNHIISQLYFNKAGNFSKKYTLGGGKIHACFFFFFFNDISQYRNKYLA